MKKIKEEEENAMMAKEPIASYKRQNKIDTTPLPFMSMKEVFQNGMPLEESERLLFEKISSDFHKKQ